ncbi:putative leucine-rich repeat domain superfamily [Helianthus anomalus]
MTNAAVVAMSKNCPELVVFRLCIIGRYRPDRVTGEPMDEGFKAIVKNCKKLIRLAVSGLLTDKAFFYIGQFGKLVRTLSVAFAGDSDMGLRYVFEGCTNLQKLEIRDRPFGDSALWSCLHHFYNMRFVWMSSCRVA